ncbi:hypothetical protein MYRNA_220 [Mycobacterium phage Myrna]|uniref:Uncharacterized protein n=1 Tax=Mycobacterium phage Myrna TaxID=546805 RepID=B5LJJ0_9CAUD|nr:gp220 [Mycobacterium phage Myrna]ACH62187.1 hypothetical protein MYRNA_220 [Mycobacterium phage Myrna]
MLPAPRPCSLPIAIKTTHRKVAMAELDVDAPIPFMPTEGVAHGEGGVFDIVVSYEFTMRVEVAPGENDDDGLTDGEYASEKAMDSSPDMNGEKTSGPVLMDIRRVS